MAEEKATEFQLPVLTQEEIETNKKVAEENEKILTPPEGKVFIGMRAFCPKHGDITQASKVIKHKKYVKGPDGKVIPFFTSDVICLACISDMWRDYVNKELKSPIQCSPVFIDEAEAEKMKQELLKQQEAANAEAPEEAKPEAEEEVTVAPAKA